MIKNIINKLIPPKRWQIPVTILIGIFFGLALLVFKISNAASYMTDDPRACINCHVMSTHYSSWLHSSHRERANCNDCHVPHDNFVRKYLFKAQDGLRHATIFTLRQEPQVIRIKEAGKSVVQENCKRCHEQQINRVKIINVKYDDAVEKGEPLCWNCHRETPHGRVASQAASINAIIPKPESALPEWLKEFQNSKKIINNY
jgi:cytochrome c nitrite reductase small subunit